GVEVAGMNVLAVRDAGRAAVATARGGDGPTILELKTYRYRGHSMSDPAKYRTSEAANEERSKSDPIELVNAKLLAAGWASEDDLKATDKRVKAGVEEAVDFARESPEPPPEELWTDVLVEA